MAIEMKPMGRNELKIKVGDRVVISRPTSIQLFAARVDRYATVTGVRSRSFDAGGLCFRMDGREWKGHSRVRLAAADASTHATISPATVEEASGSEQAREVALLASLLSSHHEMEWLKLGLVELRRIAAQHGITAGRGEALEGMNAEGQDG
jgi:hypothetical protein